MNCSKRAWRESFIARFLLLFSVFLLAVGVIYVTVAIRDAKAVYDGVVRLHILADSDDESEQALKLRVRDEILEVYGKELAAFSDKESAERVLSDKADEIRALCEGVIAASGKDHGVSVSFCREYYPTRAYDGFDLPAGEYTSLRVTIGSGEGKNWFCMVYPPLCTASCESDEALLEAGFTTGQVRLLTENEEGYTLRFKVVESVSECVETVKGWFSR